MGGPYLRLRYLRFYSSLVTQYCGKPESKLEYFSRGIKPFVK